MRVEYHPVIEDELREIVEYYDKCSPELGVEFLNEFERVMLVGENCVPSTMYTILNVIRDKTQTLGYFQTG